MKILSINIGSILLLRVKSVKKDFTDLTMSISNSVLIGFNADFDGFNYREVKLLSLKCSNCWKTSIIK